MKKFLFILIFCLIANFIFATNVTVNNYMALVSALNSVADTIFIDGTITVTSSVQIRRKIVFIGINNGTLDGNNNCRILNIGIYYSYPRTAIIQDLTFKNGKISSDYGSAIISTYTDTLKVKNCEFINNNAYWGGAIYGTEFKILLFENCEFKNNSATAVGGAIWVGGSDGYEMQGNLSVINCLFTNNSAGVATGALDMHNWNKVTIFNSVFTNNHSGSTDPGAICVGGNGQTNLINCTIAKNHSNGNAGGIGLWSAEHLNIHNCVLTGNTAANGASDITRTPANYANSTVKMYNSVYQKITNPVTLSTNVNNFSNVVPNSVFVDFTNSDFHLQNGSLAINSGSDNDYVTQWNSNFLSNTIATPAAHYDIDGNTRAIYIIDMGAYESNYASSVITDSVCENTIYDFNGKILTEGGIYYDTIPNAFLGGDSIVTLILTQNPSYSQTENFTICDYELPFIYRDSVFLASGTKNIVYQTTLGCDSVFIVNLNVLPSDIQRDTVSICVDLLPYIYNDTIFEIGTQSGNYFFLNQCNGLFLNLSIFPKIEILPPEIPKICADDKNFILQFQNIDEVNTILPTNYGIIFDDNAIAAGFENQNGNFGNENKIVVQMPEKIYPDYYNCKIILSNNVYDCAPQMFDIQIPVLYPDSIMEQKWNDVIALKNANYNGGFDFSAYQWYQNGAILLGETFSYIYLGKENSLQLGDKYSVLITRVDGSQIFSCEFNVKPPRPEFTSRPYVVQNGNSLIIYTSSKAKAHLWTITGVLLQSAQISTTQCTMPAPASGAYILEIFPENQIEPRIVLPIIIR